MSELNNTKKGKICNGVKLLKVKIISNEEIAPQRFKIRLEAPSISKFARAGQFVMLKCSRGFEPFLRRPFSFHRIEKNNFEILYQVIGKGTKVLSQRKKGETLDIIGPLGNGFSQSSVVSRQSSAILVGGGIGVAPLLALATKVTVYRLPFTVLLGAKTKGHILCQEDFKRLGAKVIIATEDGSKGKKGLATDLLKAKIRNTEYGIRYTVYACGPREMLKTVAKIAESNNIPCEVSLEERMACGTGACLGCAVETASGFKMVCKDGPVFNARDIKW